MTTILNIQNDEQTLHRMSWILEGEGYDVVNATEPGGTHDHPTPDVIIINTNMSVPEKRACIQALRALAPGIGVIDLSAGAELPSHDTGADSYLNKPFHADDLVARVRALTLRAIGPAAAEAEAV